MDDYHGIADALAADIAAGRLRGGDRLPPQRRFARDRGIANSTASRVYGELIRRGLAVGETGRGTFIRAAGARPEPALAEPAAATVDLELNFPVLPEMSALVADSLAALLRPDALTAALRPTGLSGSPVTREVAARHLARGGWTPDPGSLLFTGNGRQAIAAVVAALVPAGERLGVEELTYPVVKGIAARLGVTLVPIEMDADGMVPGALASTPRLRAVYVQSSLHNPLGVTMSARRQAELAEVVAARELHLIDDGINGFLAPETAPPASDRAVVLDSLSKRLGPGLTLGFVSAPPELADRVATAIRSGGWAPAHFALEAGTRLMADGTLTKIEAAKRADAAARQALAHERLPVRADRRSYHCWWELPDPWRAETFVAAAARRGIAVTPAAAFAVTPGRAPNAVRLALASPPVPVLAQALDTLAGLARTTPEDVGVE
ncbi:PLP-dependent aminotransferase family protein [Amycolatopsis acidiphila]|uniref:PLP-dependent aminotransferase family protein n=1 Tax=Amycolatopsis acidiphila TaxID=715473 RepID=A0A558A833_9PSEU|nr:PLP-dependent aminotransferase family protein [Amycolatopsis acidiphila]TVT20417.1 PLP-dependent aminotransferase family protein [Amycolatopsis acidiphila]UIJ59217.1 PLP-dependent aminotransferase family protein [Amycolatopsis acidiphila]GHG79197.1 GntR family transcriptional regulator [Amycolatopsis acidiphila]